jgi:signal transduction histidine kinase
MHQSKLFNLTRWRLAGWYAGVMGLILALGGFAIYRVMNHSEWQALHRELESVAGTLHDSLEPRLKKPGTIEESVQQSLPGLCISGSHCINPSKIAERHILGVVQQDSYYLRFFDLSGRVVATVGKQPEINTAQLSTATWQTLKTSEGERYHQFSLLLKAENGSPWGYLQVGRSLQDFDHHLASLQLSLLIGLPVAMLLVSGASWWLAGLAMQPVYQSYRQIQQFTADAAHELRTPLAAIRATVESTLQARELPEAEARSTLQTIERQNGRLAQLVQDLLLLSRMDLQVLPFKRQPCCLNDLISDSVEEIAALAIAAEVTLKADIRVHQPLYVTGDEEQLYRLLANLITNAIQHTPALGTVRVSLDQDDHQAVIQIQDTGIGIAAEEQPRIFDRFYRVQSDRSRATGGAGLGLAIAKAIVQTHQGRIEVESHPGQGSTFVVRLPSHLKQSLLITDVG